jgi:hypothetical protein
LPEGTLGCGAARIREQVDASEVRLLLVFMGKAEWASVPDHGGAAAGAMLAGIDALLHPIQVPTARGALVAHARASATQILVQREICQHRVGGDMAQVRADRHQAKMIGLDVPPALLQAMIHRHAETHAMATLAIFDALLHVGDRMTVGTCRCLFHNKPAVVK